MIDYIVRYGCCEEPFDKNSKDIYVENRESTEIQKRLSFLQATNGIGLLTGAPGMGKTKNVRYWAGKLPESRYKVVYSALSTITPQEFYRQLVSGLDGIPAYKKTANYAIIQKEIIRLNKEQHITPVIILDEANHFGSGILNDLKIIMNFDMDTKAYAIVLLVGLPILNNTLRLSVHESLRQRIVMNYNAGGLSDDETRLYIKGRLKGAGCRQEVFDENALEAIAGASKGVPRMINKICSRSMIIGNSRKKDLIDSDIIREAVEDIQLG